jgi:hypothetical protein
MFPVSLIPLVPELFLIGRTRLWVSAVQDSGRNAFNDKRHPCWTSVLSAQYNDPRKHRPQTLPRPDKFAKRVGCRQTNPLFSQHPNSFSNQIDSAAGNIQRPGYITP